MKIAAAGGKAEVFAFLTSSKPAVSQDGSYAFPVPQKITARRMG